MKEDIKRRQFILGAGAAVLLNAMPRLASSSEKLKFRFLSSDLSPEKLEEQKKAAVASLTAQIPPVREMDYLREYARHLPVESQMYIPDVHELKSVIAESMPQLNELASNIQTGSFGLFVFATIDAQGKNMQRLYILQKKKGGEAQFVKAYRISTAQKGFGNGKNSGQTPLGFHTIHSGKRGLFGEVVSGLNKYRDLFYHLKYKGKDYWFVKGFGDEPGNDVAEVVTDQYLLVGKETEASRGIRIHGANRSGKIGRDGKWISFLGGNRRSGGCIRMSNTDVRDMYLSGYIKFSDAKSATRVMIYATEKARKAAAPSGAPARWIPPIDIR